MKTFKFPSLLFLFLIFISTSNFSQNQYRESLIEDSIFQFQQTFNLTQQIIDSTTISSTSIENQTLFAHYMKEKNHRLFMRTFRNMLSGTTHASMLQGIYEDALRTYLGDAMLIPNFELWKLQIHHSHSHSQREADSIDCKNIDFEKGDLSNWEPSMGEVPCPAPGFQGCVQNIVAGTMGIGNAARHQLMLGGNDPDCPAVSRLYDGNFSLRLGDELNGANSDLITHRVTITEDNKFYIYQFAVVFQEPPGHNLLSQPFFNVVFKDSFNNTINTCGNYFVSNGQGNPGFVDVFTNGRLTWRYKPWSKIAVDLSNYVGQEITVNYTVADCGAGGHEARAYIDGKCEKPEITIQKDCKNIQLEVDSGFLAYQWYEGKNKTILPNDTNRIIDVKGPGIYHVDLISESGCTLTLDTLLNELYILLNQEIEKEAPSCHNTADGKISVHAYGGVPPYAYSIDNGLTFQLNNNFLNLGVGTYTIIVRDDSLCYDTIKYNLLGPPEIKPNLVIENATCFGYCDGKATAYPTGGISASGDYKVEFNGTLSITNGITNLCTGNHLVKVTDDKGCKVTIPFIIAEPLEEVIDNIIKTDENCFNDCSGSIIIQDAQATSYSIDNGLTFQLNNNFPNLCAQAGPYQVAIKTAKGCIGRSAIPILQPTSLSILPLFDTFICLNESVMFEAKPFGGTPPYSIQWNTGQMGPILKESPSFSTKYVVTVTDNNGCKISEEVNIGLHPQPIANFIPTPGPITDVFNTKIQFTNTTEYGASLTYEWYIDNLATYNTRHATYEFPDMGGKSYINCLKIENKQGCRDSICKELYIKHEVLVYVPNSFTPNKDDINDLFIPVTEGLRDENYQFLIYNRWGELVFSTSNKQEGWNGTFKGKKVQDEVYVWHIIGTTKETNEDYEKVGHVTLLRKL